VRTGPVRTRSFVMILVAWMALSLAPVVALGPPAAGFAVLAAGLVAVTTLRFSVVWGALVAALSFVAYTVAIAVGPVPPWALGPDELQRLGRSLVRVQTLLPDLLAGLSLAGTALFAELASTGLEWDLVLRGTVREAPDRAVPADAGPDPGARARLDDAGVRERRRGGPSPTRPGPAPR
jgi:hypothetical protein